MGISDRLMGLKFMQRASAKKEGKEEQRKQEAAADAAKWRLSSGQVKRKEGRRIIVFGDPPPQATSGRMSFGHKAKEEKPEAEEEEPRDNAKRGKRSSEEAPTETEPRKKKKRKLPGLSREGKEKSESGGGEKKGWSIPMAPPSSIQRKKEWRKSLQYARAKE